jgi:hypothetical protein
MVSYQRLHYDIIGTARDKLNRCARGPRICGSMPFFCS